MKFISEFYVVVTVLFVACSPQNAFGLNCYQCSGSDPSKPFQCNEWLSDDIDIKPEPCGPVYDAKYCIKHTGRFEVLSLKCYRCSSRSLLDCADGMIHQGAIEPQSCDDVFEAEYCVKMISLEGGIGAKRFCSSVHLGNYCNYVKQPGDTLSYRTCVFTCTGEGCNFGTSLKIIDKYVMLISSVLLFVVNSYRS